MTGSWDQLAQHGAEEREPVDNEFDTLCAHVFAGPPGRALLAALRKRYFDAPINPLAPDRALALRINQQQFVRELETACERGLATKAKA